MCAIENRRTDAVRLLLRKNASRDLINLDGQTALQMADNLLYQEASVALQSVAGASTITNGNGAERGGADGGPKAKRARRTNSVRKRRKAKT